MRRSTATWVAILVGASVVLSTPSVAFANNKNKPIPLLLIGVGSSVAVLDTGYQTNVNTPNVRPPLDKEWAARYLNGICDAQAEQEIRIESDGKTLGVKTSKVLAKPSNPTSNPPTGGAPAGYFLWRDSCIHGVSFKKVPRAKFYQIYIDGDRVGTYSYEQLRREKFNPLFSDVNDNVVCAVQTPLLSGAVCR